ncbi:MAG: anhydro-N-acetylmuramic acid kinase [Pseudomonadota bacterium]|nr:anhydro-N-acetylmuramic acid kinase [Pseudomonadota bacterium]
MSGTSLDGVDGVVADFESASGSTGVRVVAHAKRAFAPALRAELAALNRSGDDELHRAALAANALARDYAALVETLCTAASLARDEIGAIGCHGQTVRHRPGEFDGTGYTVQLNAPALLAELTGIDVVADFRSRDVAAGGQGAPLVPAFHRAMFGRAGTMVAVLNLGGIANLTVVGAAAETIGFDCGPANALLDLWCERSSGRAFDADGAAAARGAVDQRLLDALLAEPYFTLAPPKSTGLDLFNARWLDARLDGADARARLRPEDVQATLAELTARVVADACRRHAAAAAELIVCGGGAFNVDLMRRLAESLAPMPVVASDMRGLPADQVEASAFAWLARAFVARVAGNVPTATGAAGPRILGALYPAR